LNAIPRQENTPHEVLFVGPGFPTYPILVKELGGTTTSTQTRQKADGTKEIDMDDLKNQITPQTRAILLGSPGNPDGNTVSKDEFEELIGLARKNNFKIIVDDPYSFAIFERGEYCDPLTLFPEAKDVMLIIHSASKQYSIPGARIGYVVGDEDFLNSCRVSQDCSVLAAATPSMKILEAILQDPDTPDIMGKRLDELGERRKLIMSRFAVLSDLFELNWPTATYYCFAKLKLENTSDLRFCLRLLEEAGVIVLPGAGFGPSGRGFVRICFGYTPEEINKTFDAIEGWWGKNKQSLQNG
jgi:aspartate/methionine/tyrosine aminotransferase